MQFCYSDSQEITPTVLNKNIKKIAAYRAQIQGGQELPSNAPERALFTWQDDALLAEVQQLTRAFRGVKHVILIGIGGSSLGTEAIHAVLARAESPILHILDAASAFELDNMLRSIKNVRSVKHLAVCIVSKSGTTTETVANSNACLGALEQQFGTDIYAQTICIGDPGTPLLTRAKKAGMHTFHMPSGIGGRYSVFTAVGLVPLALLGHNVKNLLNGLQEATNDVYEGYVAEEAARLYAYLTKGYRHLNFFAFDTRLVRLGKWYRQLVAESIGKEFSRAQQRVRYGWVPTISTPVELHSVGQLYFSGFTGVYTDFVSFSDTQTPSPKLAKAFFKQPGKKRSLPHIQEAIFSGVTMAYDERSMPYRKTDLGDSMDLDFSLGLFMGMRMLETMYVAQLLDVDPFNQPNVELYKNLTRDILTS